MSIEVLQRHLGPSGFTRLLNRLAPQGWNANTQFFLVFLGVLGLHLWLVQVVMRSADSIEPGDRQGYFASGGHREDSDEAPKPAAAGERENTEAKEPENPERSASFVESALVLTDAPLVATPLSETDQKREPAPPNPGKLAVAEKTKTKAIPSPNFPAETFHQAEIAKSEAVVPPSKERDLPVAPSAESGPAPEKSNSMAASEATGPRLSDLIVDAPVTPSKPAAEKPAAGASSHSDPQGQHRLRSFRQLP